MFVHPPARQRQVGPDPLGVAFEGLLVTTVEHVGEQTVVGGQLRASPVQSCHQFLGDRVRIADVDGLQLDQQLVAHRHRLGRRAGEPVQVRATRVGQGEHPFVGPPLLAH